jgi:hypothetical protein
MTVVFTLQNRRSSSSVASARYVLDWQAPQEAVQSSRAHRRPTGWADSISARGEGFVHLHFRFLGSRLEQS